MEANWKNGRQSLIRIECHSENSKGVYCLQYDDKKIVSGLRDNTIKVSTQAGRQKGPSLKPGSLPGENFSLCGG